MNRDEMLNFLKNEARGISVMFGPNCETIVHDMTRPGHPILAIFNGTVTGREVGSTADIFGDIGDYDESIYQDYINQMVLSRDGRTLKSSTFNIVGEDYHFALGINLDITNMVRAGQMLSELTATSGDLQQTLMQDARSQLEELLREGQTLWTVSNAYGLSMTELLRLNPQIAKPNEVQSGTRVRVR